MKFDPWARRLQPSELDAAQQAAEAASDAVRHDPAALAEVVAHLLALLWLPNSGRSDAVTANQRALEHVIERVTELAQEATALAITRAALERASSR